MHLSKCLNYDKCPILELEIGLISINYHRNKFLIHKTNTLALFRYVINKNSEIIYCCGVSWVSLAHK